MFKGLQLGNKVWLICRNLPRSVQAELCDIQLAVTRLEAVQHEANPAACTAAAAATVQHR